MGLDLTNIEDVMKAIATEDIELDEPPKSGEDQSDDEGDGESEDQSEGEDDQEGEGEGEGEGAEPEPIPLVANEEAEAHFKVRVWVAENIGHSIPDRVYLVQAEYPSEAIQAAQEDAQVDLGPDLNLWGVFQP